MMGVNFDHRGDCMPKRFVRVIVGVVVLAAAVLFAQSPAVAAQALQPPAAAPGTLHGPYQVLGIQSRKCINVPGGSTSNNVTIIIYTCQNPAVQNDQWWAEDHGNDIWEIWSVRSGKCLTVRNASMDNNAPIIQYDCSMGGNETWDLASNGTIINTKSKKCLTVKNADTANGTTLLQFTCNGASNQRWTWSKQW
jgi:non-reducing end alpha-L-arabinofuranosidase